MKSFPPLGGISNSYFIAIDGGEINTDTDDESFGGRLIGSSFGTKLQSRNLEISLHYDIPLYKKDVSRSREFFGVSFRAKL